MNETRDDVFEAMLARMIVVAAILTETGKLEPETEERVKAAWRDRYHAAEPRILEPTSEYMITGRGQDRAQQCYGTIQPDPPYELGEIILVPMRIAGIECFKSLHGDKPGKPIGVMVRVIEWGQI